MDIKFINFQVDPKATFIENLRLKDFCRKIIKRDILKKWKSKHNLPGWSFDLSIFARKGKKDLEVNQTRKSAKWKTIDYNIILPDRHIDKNFVYDDRKYIELVLKGFYHIIDGEVENVIIADVIKDAVSEYEKNKSKLSLKTKEIEEEKKRILSYK